MIPSNIASEIVMAYMAGESASSVARSYNCCHQTVLNYVRRAGYKSRVLNDLTGRKFGRLTAIKALKERRRHNIVWLCQCSCGKLVNVIGTRLLDGNTKSCGCLRHECSVDLVGKVFGRLAVIEKTEERTKNGKVVWLCRCKCGNIIKVRSSDLQTGNTKSCGCLHRDMFSGKSHPCYKHGRSGTVEYQREHSRKRLARKRDAIVGSFTEKDVERRMELLGGRCVYCGGPYEQVDHLFPLSRGGEHALRNLAPSCQHCNAVKHNRKLNEEWRPGEWLAVDRIKALGLLVDDTNGHITRQDFAVVLARLVKKIQDGEIG